MRDSSKENVDAAEHEGTNDVARITRNAISKARMRKLWHGRSESGRLGMLTVV